MVQGICIFAILVSICSLLLTHCHPPKKIDLRRYRALGYGMAIETSKLLHDQGQIIVVSFDRSAPVMKPFQIEMDTFYSTIKKETHLTVLREETAPTTAIAAAGIGMSMDSKIYKKLIAENPKISAIVSFLGPPRLTDEEFNQLPTELPKVVAYTANPHGLKRIFGDQLIHVAIANAFPPQKSKPGKKLQDLFNFYYKVITEKDAAD